MSVDKRDRGASVGMEEMLEEMREDRRQAERYLLHGPKAGADASWAVAAELTEGRLTERKRLLLEARREAARRKPGSGKGRPGWVASVQMRYLYKTERPGREGEFLGERTVRMWWRDIVRLAVEIHLRLKSKK